MWNSEELGEFSDVDRFIRARCPPRVEGPCQCSRDVVIPYYLDPLYMGLEDATNCAKILCENINVHLKRADNVQHLIHGDLFHTGFKFSSSIRALTLKFSVDRCLRKDYQIGERTTAWMRASQVKTMLELEEPERLSRWLRTYYEEDLNGEVTVDIALQRLSARF
ncbi:hypothetical protein BU26DRAFT_513656 [Trematosphaeria pertusa]|uniref:Uncharacterized protein n=1 Tax=Trematosphaeria pertusa TaxID=390896 RepID=A0A6A6J2W2_9PLEO|nr:uncharacterized protein BU26DRAFT_513656 [Trematosphaeria pertusa]KAF2256908.1 hypothetical protein BU26DRAFT_513656 [Trematosphaeria pertusa]